MGLDVRGGGSGSEGQKDGRKGVNSKETRKTGNKRTGRQ